LAGDLGESAAHRRGGCFDNLTANIANEKHNWLLDSVAMAAGKISVARREPVDEAVFKQEIQRPVDRNRRGALTGRRSDPIDQLVSAERAAFAGKNLENSKSAWS